MNHQDRQPEAPRRTNLITELNENDVLLGRGSRARQFIGNQRFRTLVAERRERYSTGTPKNNEKDRIARELLNHIGSLGGRFLKMVETERPVHHVVNSGAYSWYVVEESIALEKCKQALRDGRVGENRGPSNGGNEGINVGEDISRESSSGMGIGVAVDPASSLATGHGLPPSLPSHLVPFLSSAVNESTGPFVDYVNPLIFQLTPSALQQQITMSQLMATNIFNPSSFNRSIQNWSDAYVLPSVYAPVDSMVQGMFHDMYRSLNTSDAATSLHHGGSLANNSLIPRPRYLTQRQTDSVAAAPGPATVSKSENVRSSGAVVGSKRKDSDHGVAANKAAKSAHQRSPEDSAVHGLLQLQKDSAAHQAGRSSNHAMRNDGIYSMTRSTKSYPSPNKVVSAQALMSSLENRPMITEEQLMIERATMTNEERMERLSDLFGKKCVVDIDHRKGARRYSSEETIELLQQMKRELQQIPHDKKRALMEAQMKCGTEEFSDDRLKQFLQCEGMNAKVRLEVCMMRAIISFANLKMLTYFDSFFVN